MNYLDEQRTTEFTVTDSSNRGLIGKKYRFNSEGKLLTDFGNTTSALLIQEMKEYISTHSVISGIDHFRFDDGIGGYADTLIERYIDTTLGRILDHTTRVYGDNEAIVDATTGQRLTYRELGRQCDHLARKLIDLGVKKGDTVALVAKNSADQFVAKYGIIQSGAVVVNISPFEKKYSLEQELRQTDTTIVFMKQDSLIEIMYEICPELRTSEPGHLNSKKLPLLRAVICMSDEEHPGILNMNKLMEEVPMSSKEDLIERKSSISSSDIATIIHTSGTTGLPKGVMLKHSAIAENVLQHINALGITSADRIFVPVPMFHALGSIGSALSSMVSGATLVTHHRPKAEIVLPILRDERCSMMFSVPSLYISLIEQVNKENFDHSSLHLRMCVMAGASCSEKTIRDTHQILGVREILVMYGMTEAGPGISSTVANDSIEVKCHTVGKPWPGTTVKLDKTYLTDDGRKCGEICVHGYNVMAGYYKDRPATEKAIDKDGWLHTGDLGIIRDDGNIVICGRLKDIIICNGENISPLEVEKLLESYPDIQQSVVVAAKDERAGEVVFAFALPKVGKHLDEKAVIEYCSGKITKLKVPVRVIGVSEFPKSGTGKILRRDLRLKADEIHSADMKRKSEGR